MLVKLYATLQLAGAGRTVTVPAGPSATVQDVLEELFRQAPQLREQILTPDGQATMPHVNIMLKGRLVRDLQDLQTPVGDAKELAIFPPVAGG